MQSQIIKEDGLTRTMSLTLPAQELEKGIQQKVSQMQRKVSLAGFRPGKVPEDVIKQHYATSLLNEVGGDLMKNSFLKLAVDQEINLAGIKMMEPKQLAFGKDFIFEVSYEVFPVIKINSSLTGKVERIRARVEEADIQAMVEAMRRSKATLADTIIGAPASRDNVVVIDYEVDNKPPVEDVAVDLAGSLPSPHFVAALVGMKEGDSKSIEDRVQDDKNEERRVTFHIRVKKVKRKVLPQLDNSFYRQYGVENERDFYARIKKDMEFELNLAVQRLMRRRIYELLLAEHKELEAPATQVEREAHRLRHQIARQLEQQAQGANAVDKQKLPLELFMEEAEKKVKVGMLLVELAQQNKISVTDEQVKDRITKIASTYQDPAKVEEYYQKNEQLREHIKNDLLEDRVIEDFLTRIKVEDRQLSYQEVMDMATKRKNA